MQLCKRANFTYEEELDLHKRLALQFVGGHCIRRPYGKLHSGSREQKRRVGWAHVKRETIDPLASMGPSDHFCFNNMRLKLADN